MYVSIIITNLLLSIIFFFFFNVIVIIIIDIFVLGVNYQDCLKGLKWSIFTNIIMVAHFPLFQYYLQDYSNQRISRG